MDTGGGLLGDALDARRDPRPARGVLGQRALEQGQDHAVLLGGGLVRGRHEAGLLELHALVDQQGSVTAVVEDHVRAGAVGPAQHLLGAPPVLLERLALPGVDRHALRVVGGPVRADRDGGGRVVLRRVDVAGGPADLRPQIDQGLDQHGRLDGHVEGPGDPGAGQRLAHAELGAHRHQAGHLVLGEADLLAAELGQGQVGDLEVVHGAPRCGAALSARGVPEGSGCRRTPTRLRWFARAGAAAHHCDTVSATAPTSAGPTPRRSDGPV